MDSRDEIKQKIDRLAGSLERLDRAYTQYFAGAEDAGPGELRQRVDRLARDLRDAKIHNTEWQFRIKRLLQRYRTFKAKWDRNLKKLERGVMKRGQRGRGSEGYKESSASEPPSDDSEQEVYELSVSNPESSPSESSDSDSRDENGFDKEDEFAQFGLDPEDVDQ